MTFSDWIQFAAVIVALAASITALVIATQDRRTQLAIAREARAHDRLSLELEYAVRMSANRNRGGSTDALERAQLGAEALALAGVVGPKWAPRQYARAMNYKTTEQLRERLSDTDDIRTPRWVKDKIESGLAVQSIIAELYGATGEEMPAIAADPDHPDEVDDGWPTDS